MRKIRRCAFFTLLAAAVTALLAGLPGRAAAQTHQAAPHGTGGALKLGLILDLSGPYSRATGIGSVAAAKMAVEDFGGRVLDRPIEILIADGHNRADHAATIARDWFDNQHVDAIMDVTGSSEALAVQRIAGARNKIVILDSAVAERLSNEACTPTSVHYSFNTRAIANTVGLALVERGEKTWFFITVDYTFGYDLEHDTQDVVEAQGGRVVGGALYPLGATDFTSYLARAHESGASVIALANAGADLDNAIRQAATLGMIPGPQVFAGLGLQITGVDTLGLAAAQGMVLGQPFYWDMNEATRAWSKRFFARVKAMPNAVQAALYSSTTHYLQAVARAGTADTAPVMAAMREAPIDDFFTHGGHIRADGQMVHDMYLWQVKPPSQSRYPWDYLTRLATVSGDKAFGALAQSKCPLVER